MSMNALRIPWSAKISSEIRSELAIRQTKEKFYLFQVIAFSRRSLQIADSSVEQEPSPQLDESRAARTEETQVVLMYCSAQRSSALVGIAPFITRRVSLVYGNTLDGIAFSSDGAINLRGYCRLVDEGHRPPG